MELEWNICLSFGIYLHFGAILTLCFRCRLLHTSPWGVCLKKKKTLNISTVNGFQRPTFEAPTSKCESGIIIFFFYSMNLLSSLWQLCRAWGRGILCVLRARKNAAVGLIATALCTPFWSSVARIGVNGRHSTLESPGAAERNFLLVKHTESTKTRKRDIFTRGNDVRCSNHFFSALYPLFDHKIPSSPPYSPQRKFPLAWLIPSSWLEIPTINVWKLLSNSLKTFRHSDPPLTTHPQFGFSFNS